MKEAAGTMTAAFARHDDPRSTLGALADRSIAAGQLTLQFLSRNALVAVQTKSPPSFRSDGLAEREPGLSTSCARTAYVPEQRRQPATTARTALFIIVSTPRRPAHCVTQRHQGDTGCVPVAWGLVSGGTPTAGPASAISARMSRKTSITRPIRPRVP